MTRPTLAAEIDAVWRIEQTRLIASLGRLVRDVGLAEDLAQDALEAALRQWPDAGIPRNPGAWLMSAAKNKAIDQIRRQQLIRRKHEEIRWDLDEAEDAFAQVEARLDDKVNDDMLSLILTACHPVLSIDAQVALTLRLIGGLTTEEIARGLLTSEATIAQRIVRAKRSLADAGVGFELPSQKDLPDRLQAVLRVLYLIFNEGYSATVGGDWLRPTLCNEALRMSRVVTTLVPDAAEAHGLLALMELQASRTHARVSASGEPILLLEQNRAAWDQLLIHRGLASLARAEALSASRGPYVLQAAIAACHARARRAEETEWLRIATLYGELAATSPSPVVEVNRAVAVGMAYGPEAGLRVIDAVRETPALSTYPFLPAVRADLLVKLGRVSEAREEFMRAAELTRNSRDKRVLLHRARSCLGPRGSEGDNQE